MSAGELAEFCAHWDARVAQFELENQRLLQRHAAAQVVLLGDSLTEQFDLGKHFRGRPVLNRGINSDHLLPLEQRSLGIRLAAERLAPNPSHVFILAGINDVNRDPDGVGVQLVAYRELLRELHDRYPRAQLICQSLLPTRAPRANLNGAVCEFNAGLHGLATEAGAHFLDLHALYANGRGELPRYISRDGLHPRRFSQARWRRAIEAHLHWSSRRGLPRWIGL